MVFYRILAERPLRRRRPIVFAAILSCAGLLHPINNAQAGSPDQTAALQAAADIAKAFDDGDMARVEAMTAPGFEQHLAFLQLLRDYHRAEVRVGDAFLNAFAKSAESDETIRRADRVTLEAVEHGGLLSAISQFLDMAPVDRESADDLIKSFPSDVRSAGGGGKLPMFFDINMPASANISADRNGVLLTGPEGSGVFSNENLSFSRQNGTLKLTFGHACFGGRRSYDGKGLDYGNLLSLPFSELVRVWQTFGCNGAKEEGIAGVVAAKPVVAAQIAALDKVSAKLNQGGFASRADALAVIDHLPTIVMAAGLQPQVDEFLAKATTDMPAGNPILGLWHPVMAGTAGRGEIPSDDETFDAATVTERTDHLPVRYTIVDAHTVKYYPPRKSGNAAAWSDDFRDPDGGISCYFSDTAHMFCPMLEVQGYSGRFERGALPAAK